MKDVPKAIEAVWKIESTRLIAAIARLTPRTGLRLSLGLGRSTFTPNLERWSLSNRNFTLLFSEGREHRGIASEKTMEFFSTCMNLFPAYVAPVQSKPILICR
jgi:hypothetical protein